MCNTYVLRYSCFKSNVHYEKPCRYILPHVTHVNGWESAVYMSTKLSNFSAHASGVIDFQTTQTTLVSFEFKFFHMSQLSKRT